MRRTIVEEKIVKTKTQIEEELIVTDELVQSILDYVNDCRYVVGFTTINGEYAYKYLTEKQVRVYLQFNEDEEMPEKFSESQFLRSLWHSTCEHANDLGEMCLYQRVYDDAQDIAPDGEPFARQWQTRWENDYEGEYTTFTITLREVIEDFFETHKDLVKYQEINRSITGYKPTIKRYEY